MNPHYNRRLSNSLSDVLQSTTNSANTGQNSNSPHRNPSNTAAISRNALSTDALLLSPTRRNSTGPICDRFVTAQTGDALRSSFSYLSSKHTTPTKPKRKHSATDSDGSQREESQIYMDIMTNELLPLVSPLRGIADPILSPTRANLLQYALTTTPRKKIKESPLHRAYSTSHLSLSSQFALQTPKKTKRYISKTPYKVLDAPELQDDFYLNLVDWSSSNFLGVGLGTCVYLWNANTSKVTKLCDLGPNDSVTSVSWIQRCSHIAVGTNRGLVQLWDVHKCKKVRQFTDHQARVGSLSWNTDLLSSGSRDRIIYHRDVRDHRDHIAKLTGHRQEVCGLKWNNEETQLASGGNDNKLFIWDQRSTTPLLQFQEHVAAVKAISWSPHQHGLLASGGGTADRCIRFWNTVTGQHLSTTDTGSQVCNLAWSKNSPELVSTHGYSQNQIVVWKYPNMTQLATLTGHTFRVLYLAMSPDGQHIVTGAGDETLRFWTVFNKTRNRNDSLTGIMTVR